MFTVIIPNSVKKDLKKLDKPLLKEILHLLQSISDNPYQGISLTGKFSDLVRTLFGPC